MWTWDVDDPRCATGFCTGAAPRTLVHLGVLYGGTFGLGCQFIFMTHVCAISEGEGVISSQHMCMVPCGAVTRSAKEGSHAHRIRISVFGVMIVPFVLLN